MARPLCLECGLDVKKKGHPKWCHEDWLVTQHIEVQIDAARQRLARMPEELRSSRVPQELWPDGRRWCSGCQSFMRLQDCAGARCKACTSAVAYSGHAMRSYGITPAQQLELLRFQNGRCYVCKQKARTRRLALDHDHVTGEVRGLLCADPERGCNHAVLGNLEGKGDALELARRLVAYLENSPARRLWGDDVPVQPE